MIGKFGGYVGFVMMVLFWEINKEFVVFIGLWDYYVKVCVCEEYIVVRFVG